MSLPHGAPHLVGRDAHLHRLQGLLVGQEARLIGLQGPAGIGKSALIAAALPAVASRYGGAHFVDLAGLDPQTSLARLATTVLRLPARRGPADDKAHLWLPELIIIDHAEVLAGSEAALETIAQHDRVTLVALTRRRLARSVPTVQLGPLTPTETLLLLQERTAQAGAPRLTPEATPALEELADHAVGNPLLTELLAARLPHETPERLLDRLAGHASPLAALAAAPGQDDPAQAGLLPALCIFASSFTTATAGVLTGLSAPELEEHFGRFVELGLVRVVESEPLLPSALRYRVPRALRELVNEADHPERARLRELHALHFSDLARRSAEHRAHCNDVAAIALTSAQYAELAAALRWWLPRSPAKAAELAVNLLPEAQRMGDERAVAESIEELLHGVLPAEIRLEAVAWLALLDTQSADAVQRVPRIKERLAACASLAAGIADETRHLFPLLVEVLSLPQLRDYERARRAAARGIEIARSHRRPGWASRFEVGLATISHELGDHDTAAELARAVLDRSVATDDHRSFTYAAVLLARLPTASPIGPGGISDLRRARMITRRLAERQVQSYCLVMLSLHTIASENPADAAPWLLERYELVARQRTWLALAPHLVATMALAARLERPELTARLHGALQPWSMLVLTALPRALGDLYHSASAQAQTALGRDTFAGHDRDGARLSLEAAGAEAMDFVAGLAHPRLRAPAPISAAGTPQLTAREQDALRLLALGSRNREIADRLVISPKTVMHHTSAIYRKLGVRGRAEATVMAVRLGMVSLP